MAISNQEKIRSRLYKKYAKALTTLQTAMDALYEEGIDPINFEFASVVGPVMDEFMEGVYFSMCRYISLREAKNHSETSYRFEFNGDLINATHIKDGSFYQIPVTWAGLRGPDLDRVINTKLVKEREEYAAQQQAEARQKKADEDAAIERAERAQLKHLKDKYESTIFDGA